MSYRVPLGQEFGVRFESGAPAGGNMPSPASVAQHLRAIEEQRARAALTALLQVTPGATQLRAALAGFETAFPAARFTYSDPRVGFQLNAIYWPAARIQAVEALTGMTLSARDAAILRERGLNAPGEVDGQAAASLPSHRKPLEPPMPIYALFQSVAQLMETLPENLDTMQGAAWLKAFMATFQPMLGTGTRDSGLPARDDKPSRGDYKPSREEYAAAEAAAAAAADAASKPPWAAIIAGVVVVGAGAWWLMRRGR